MLDPFSIDKDIIMKCKGFAFIPLIIIVASLCAGFLAYTISKKNDTPVEQAAEAVLKTQGVDIDFSPDDCDLDTVEVCEND